MNEKRPVAVFALLIILQVADALFSFHGIQKVGLRNYEANILIIYLSEYFGLVPVLFVAKIIAVLMLYGLYKIRTISLLWFLAGIYSLNLANQAMFFVKVNGWI